MLHQNDALQMTALIYWLSVWLKYSLLIPPILYYFSVRGLLKLEALLELNESLMSFFFRISSYPSKATPFFGKTCILKRSLDMYKIWFIHKNAQKKWFWEIKLHVLQVRSGWMWHPLSARCHLPGASAFPRLPAALPPGMSPEVGTPLSQSPPATASIPTPTIKVGHDRNNSNKNNIIF